MVDDIVSILRAQDHGHHVAAEEFCSARPAFLAPVATLGFHLPHSDGDLRWTKLLDRDCRQNRRTNCLHRYPPARSGLAKILRLRLLSTRTSAAQVPASLHEKKAQALQASLAAPRRKSTFASRSSRAIMSFRW